MVSFIIAVYNNQRYLRNAVQSVLDESKGYDIEIIIVDDGSTDNTPQIADDLAKKDDRIKVIHQENQWIYASFNNGIKVAKGEYIYILNSDDMLFDGAIQMLFDAIEKYNYPDVIWTKVMWQDVDEDQNVLSEHDMNKTLTTDTYFDSKESVRSNWLYVLESEVAVNQANLYKRELALKHPFRNDYYAGDSFFNMGIADDIDSMVFLSAPIYRYMSYQDSGMNASVGKYYGYEHRMFNELMDCEDELYSKWDNTDKLIENVVIRRLKELTYEIEILEYRNCDIEKAGILEHLFCVVADSKIRQMAKRIGREREYESRILTGAWNLINHLDLQGNIPEYVDRLVRYLPENYLDNVDRAIIDKREIDIAINDAKNKDRIGKIYYSEDW